MELAFSCGVHRPRAVPRIWGLALASLAGMMLAAPGAGAACVSAALVFAIDASGSVDDAEYATQVEGVAKGLRQPDVVDAIQSAGGLMASAVIWSDSAIGFDIVSWQPIRNAAEARSFGEVLASLPRRGTGDTHLGAGLWKALDLLSAGDLCILRRVVDVSGDGRETLYSRGGSRNRERHPVPVATARQRAEAMHVTINGLVASDAEPGVEAWYRKSVATGPDAFVVSAKTFDDFDAAMHVKLLREIAGRNVSRLDDPAQVVFPR